MSFYPCFWSVLLLTSSGMSLWMGWSCLKNRRSVWCCPLVLEPVLAKEGGKSAPPSAMVSRFATPFVLRSCFFLAYDWHAKHKLQ